MEVSGMETCQPHFAIVPLRFQPIAAVSGHRVSVHSLSHALSFWVFPFSLPVLAGEPNTAYGHVTSLLPQDCVLHSDLPGPVGKPGIALGWECLQDSRKAMVCMV